MSNLKEVAESSPKGQKTLWEKEKLLVTSNFSFSHSIFKRVEVQTRKNQGLFGKGLRKKSPLPNNIIYNWSKLKTYAVNKLCMAEIIWMLSLKVREHCGKGENVSYRHFLLFPHCFQKPYPSVLCCKELMKSHDPLYLTRGP